MMGQLDNIIFEMLKEPITVDGTRNYTYAEHPIVANKGSEEYAGYTKLQFTGVEPAEYNLNMRVHAMFCDPEEEIKKLRAAALKRQDGLRIPLVFILGDGTVRGDFVIVTLRENITKMYPREGRILEAEIDVTLREYR
jgi:phage protein U